MFFVNKEDKSIYVTRGDIGVLSIGAIIISGEVYKFKVDNIIRLQVCEKNHYDKVVLRKDLIIEEESDTVYISLTKDDTKIGPIINKPVDYWYEIELNPETSPQTLIGHDNFGPKIFRLFPEGGDMS